MGHWGSWSVQYYRMYWRCSPYDVKHCKRLHQEWTEAEYSRIKKSIIVNPVTGSPGQMQVTWTKSKWPPLNHLHWTIFITINRVSWFWKAQQPEMAPFALKNNDSMQFLLRARLIQENCCNYVGTNRKEECSTRLLSLWTISNLTFLSHNSAKKTLDLTPIRLTEEPLPSNYALIGQTEELPPSNN